MSRIRTPPFSDTNPQIGDESSPPDSGANEDVVLEATDSGALIDPDYFGEDNEGSIFTDYKIRSRYEKDNHIYMLPTAGVLSTSPVFVQMASPTLLWIVDWTCCRTGTVARFPNPYRPNDPNWVLLDDHYEPAELIQMPDGITPVYRLSGTYVYGHMNPSPQTFEHIRFGSPPWIDDSEYDRGLNETDLVEDVMDSA